MLGSVGDISFFCDCIFPESARFPAFEIWKLKKNYLLYFLNLLKLLGYILYD